MTDKNPCQEQALSHSSHGTADSRHPQDGLAWDDQVFERVPIWTREPSEEAILRTCRRHYGLTEGRGNDNDDTCTISFFASGAFNKLYLVTIKGAKALMRVSLPVYPTYKTRGEVTTLDWIRKHTAVPVAKVLAFDDTNDNEIGFEWILMELLPGKPAYQTWRKLSMAQKTAIVERIAQFQVQLSSAATTLGFHTIGTLSNKESEASPQRLVAHEFFSGKRLNFNVPRGQFQTSHAWLQTLLELTIREQTETIKKITDEEQERCDEGSDEGNAEGDSEDDEEAQEIIETAKKLLDVLPKVLSNQESERTCLDHDDLSLKNILIDDNANITGIVDWECVSALPLWTITRMPEFIRTEDEERWEKPNPAQYGPDTEDSRIPGEPSSDGIDNEGKSDLYWIHRKEYESTILSKVYRESLGKLYEENHDALKIYMYEAVLSCGGGFFVNGISQWADAIKADAVTKNGKILSWTEF